MDSLGRYFSTIWLRYYREQAAAFFHHTEVDEEDAAQEAQLQLHQRLAGHPAARLTDALVRVTYKNLLRDIYRKYFGRPRPPRWVIRLGILWQTIWELFCLERLPRQEIVMRLEQGGSESAEGDSFCRLVDQAVERLTAEEACPKPREKLVSIDARDEDDPPFELSDGQSATDPLEQSEVQLLVQAILGGQSDGIDSEMAHNLGSRLALKWTALSRELELDDETRLMLRLLYQEQLSVADVARLLGKEPQHVRRPVQRACRRIRELFAAHGVGFEDVWD